MKISFKIIFLISFLLFSLAINTFIGLRQLNQVESELTSITNQDIVLTEVVTSVVHTQLEKGILFQKTVRIAEELAFEKTTVARRQHLIDNLDYIQKGFDELATKGAMYIVQGKELVQTVLASTKEEQERRDYENVRLFMGKIEEAHIQYDALVRKLFLSVHSENYQLSLDDINFIQKEERELTREVKALLDEVQQFTKRSLHQAKLAEMKAHRSMIAGLWVTILLVVPFTISILNRMSKPLKSLIEATKKISKGQFDINLSNTETDEIGEVSRAFTVMSRRLDEYRREIEKKNEELQRNLKITREQKIDLEKMNAELDRFVSTVSHDIRAPLRGIAWYGNTLADRYKKALDDNGKEALSGIVEGAERLDQMLADLLELTRVSRIKNPYEEVNIADVIYSVLERLEFSIKESHVDVHVADSLPEVICDRIKITTVFQNLINNAVKFSSKVSKKPRVEIGYRDENGYHEFFVKDNGIGIDPIYHDQIFVMFKRLNSAREYTGTGAGLSIVKSIIEEHGGKIWVESKENEGASFIFTIPKNLRPVSS